MVSARLVAAVLVLVFGWGQGLPSQWPSWRGPRQDGTSPETGLVSSWSPEGENLLWKADFIGRSTPVVFDDRVCVIGRVGEDIDRQEVVACYGAEDGRRLWEHRFNVYNTTVPFNRVGWASLVSDPETGSLYAHGVGGQLFAYDEGGEIQWSHYLPEVFGRLSGYGGRTQTPLVDGDLLILSFVSSGWGDQSSPRHRYFAFDKRTGDLVWVSTPGKFPADMNTQSVPVVAMIEGRRLLVSGNADGWIYAMDVATGDPVWSFHLSKRGLNSSVLVDGSRVYAGHSEENIDTPDMGRLVAIDGTGTGDVTATHELWRINELSIGFSSPALHDGRLYVIDNAANLHSIESETGKVRWTFPTGTVGKSSPVWADGKLYVSEVNGRFHILEPGEDECKPLDMDELSVPGGGYAEIYGSAAVADGRIYLSTEGGLYAIGRKDRKSAPGASRKKRKPRAEVSGEGKLASLQVVPAEVLLAPGEKAALRVRALDAKGRVLRRPDAVWSAGLAGKINREGEFTADAATPFQVGTIEARAGEVVAKARVRVMAKLPWNEDFQSYEVGESPAHWVGAKGKFQVRELEQGKVLVQPPRARGLQRSATYIGPSSWSNYTIQADVRGTRAKRRRPDIGLIANGYTLDLQGNHQRLEIRSWTSVLRMAQQVPFAWEMDRWYRMKMQVARKGKKAVIRGKVWPADHEEPEEWTLTAEDPFPIPAGSPGLVGYAPAEIYYDNLKVMGNQE